MPTYEVAMTKTVTYIATIEVKAKDEEAAEEKAIALKDHKDTYWDQDDEQVEVDTVEEID